MIPNTKERELDSMGVEESREFGISTKDSAHIMTILRDTLYSDKVLAVLREYGSNAWDSHRTSGKADVPIKVVLPTASDLTLTIQDFGAGLSHQDVFEVFTQYGASTKRNDDLSVGMLGIGSKSGFAYSDTFTITSCYGGTRRIYAAALDESEKGIINLLGESPCGEETGVTIQVAVRPGDVWEFTEKARNLFRYFNPRPDINTNLPEEDKIATLPSGTLNTEESKEWVAVMGCVPYRINMDQLRASENTERLGNYVNSVSGTLFFDIGEVQVSASREELKYNDRTKNAIVKRIHSLIDEFVQKTLDEIENSDTLPWSKRLRSQILKKLNLPVPAAYKEMTYDHLKIDPLLAKHFSLNTRYATATSTIQVSSNVRILYKDTPNKLEGYNLGYYDYLVSPITYTEEVPKKNPKAEPELVSKVSTWAEVEEELKLVLEKVGATGVSIDRLSNLHWTPPPKKYHAPRNINSKHYKRVFRLDDSKTYFSRPMSDNWLPETRKPTDEDVFTIIREFESEDHDLFKEYRDDLFLVKTLGGTMPAVYGYKWTEKRPVTKSQCKGKHYTEWRKTLVKSLMTDDVKALLNVLAWTLVIYNDRIERYPVIHHCTEKEYKLISSRLGDDHILTEIAGHALEGKELLSKADLVRALKTISGIQAKPNYLELKKAEADKVIRDTLLTYPLLDQVSDRRLIDIAVLWGKHAEDWIHYITLIDRNRKVRP